MSGTTDAIRDNTLDEVICRSWNKQKKEYQYEIQRLTNEVSRYRLKLDEVQKQVISGDVRWRGRNKMTTKLSDLV